MPINLKMASAAGIVASTMNAHSPGKEAGAELDLTIGTIRVEPAP
jgi:hypothetical protein